MKIDLALDDLQTIVKSLAVHSIKLTRQIARAKRSAAKGQGKPGRLSCLAMEAAGVHLLFERMRSYREVAREVARAMDTRACDSCQKSTCGCEATT